MVGGISRVRGSEGKVGGVTWLTAVGIPAVGSVQSTAKRRRSGNHVGGGSDAQIRPIRGTTTHTGSSHQLRIRLKGDTRTQHVMRGTSYKLAPSPSPCVKSM